MKAFVDTNVILDYVLQREHYIEAKNVIAKLMTAKYELLISVGGFYTMLFVVDKYFRNELHKNRLEARELTRNVMRKTLSAFDVADHDKKTLLMGVDELRFKDIEDSCQYQLAKKHGCDIFVTFNTADFPETAIQEVEVVSPTGFTL